MSPPWIGVFLREPREWLKVVEICLCIVCLGVARGVILMGGRPDWFLLSFFTPSAFLLITSILLISKLVEDHLRPPTAELLFDFFGAVLYIAVGCCSFQYYTTFYTAPRFKAAGFAYGTLALITGICYAVDGLLPFREQVPTVAGVRTFAIKNLRVWS